MTSPSNCGLRWYGERGIVNALATRIDSLGTDGVKQLLRCIQWADNQPGDWIEQIHSAQIVVEIGLAQFGDPDLIITCQTTEGTYYAIFIEAKVVPYLYSAETGGASRIHRQLTLKYRFAQALNVSKSRSRIEETATNFANYQRGADESDLAEAGDKPRALSKQTVVALCKEAGLHKTPLENFRFVAWTWDREPFFAAENFKTSPSRPVFLQNDGTESWQATQSKLGWLSYSALLNSEGLTDTAFTQAVDTMMNSDAPTVEVDIECKGDSLVSHNINKSFSESTKAQLSELEAIAKLYFPAGSVQRLAGSTSIRLNSPGNMKPKVLVKLIPQSPKSNEYIQLGISAFLERQEWAGKEFKGPECVQEQPFYTLDLNHDQTAIDTAHQAFSELVELLGGEDDREET